MIRYLYNLNAFACSPKLASNRVIKHTAKEVGNCWRCPIFSHEDCYCSKSLWHHNSKCVSDDDFKF